MHLAHFGVCVLAQNFFTFRLDLTFFFLMRRRRCRCTTTSASHVVRLSLCVPLFISSRLCCLSSDTDLLLFLYVPYPLALLTRDAYVNRTMTYDHATSSRRSTIYSLLTPTTSIILFYFSFTFSSPTMKRYLSYCTYRCRFPSGRLGVCKGKAGACCTYTFWRSYQINQSSKVLMKNNTKVMRQSCQSAVRLGIKTGLATPRQCSLLPPRFLKPFI